MRINLQLFIVVTSVIFITGMINFDQFNVEQGILYLLIALFIVILSVAYLFIRHIKQQNTLLSHKAHHDALTRLPNRAYLFNEIDDVIKTSGINGHSVAFCMIDLNHFKEVNDTLGHHCGDELLQQVSSRITNVLRKQDLLARMGGDEFALLMPNTSAEEAVCCMQRITQCMVAPFTIAGIELDIKASIGLSSFPDHGEDSSSLLRHADTAMYQAKKSGNPYAVYEQKEDPHSVKRLALRSDLRHAIENDELLLHFQPKVSLHRKRITSVEALVRWQHPRYGFISPDEFIPLAEQNGLINHLTMWVLDEALQQCAIWRSKGINIDMAFNLSACSLQDISIPRQISDLLEKWGLSANCLTLEVTETAMMKDIIRAQDILHCLDDMGVTLSIDDFGTGFSSLSYLNQLPVDELKIDRSFVTDMTHNENNAIIVRSIIDLAHNMGRSVVAEGVEDEETLNILEVLGCDIVQGYLLSRPLPANKMDQWLQESSWGIKQAPVSVLDTDLDISRAVIA